MSRLSIVIPATGGIDRLEAGLVSVLQHRPAAADVVVVLTEPYSDPYDLAGEVTFVEARKRPGLLECLRLGLEASNAPIVHFLASGSEVSEDWAAAALSWFDDPAIGAVAPLVVESQDRKAGGSVNPTVGVTYRSGGGRRVVRAAREDAGNASVLGPTLLGGFFRRAALEAVGGLPSMVGSELADVDLALAMRTAGYECAVEANARIVQPPDAPPRTSAFRRGLYAERLFWRNAPSRGWLRSLALHPLTILAAFATTPSLVSLPLEVLGRLAAVFSVADFRRRHQLLVSLESRTTVSWMADADDGIERDERPITIALPPRQRAVHRTAS